MAWTSRTDPLRNGMSLVVCIASFARNPSLLNGLKASVSIHDTMKQMISKAPPGMGTLADEMTYNARAVFDRFGRDLPSDADVLYEQMVIAALPDPKSIVDVNMDAARLIETMIAKLSDPEHVRDPMVDLFRSLTEPVLKRLLADKSFADDLTPAFMARILDDLDALSRVETKIDSVAETLDNLAGANRDLMEALAGRFQIANAFDLSDTTLRGELEKKAQDYRALKREVDAIDPAMRRLSNLKSAAQDAIARVELEEVERLLSLVQEAELEEAAKTAELRAENALLRGRVEDAHRILSAAADSFASVDPLEPARRRLRYQARLFSYGQRFGGAGLSFAAEMNRCTLNLVPLEGDLVLWAESQARLGIALAEQGPRVSEEESVALLAEAVDAFRAALTVFTREEQSGAWAMAQMCLGNALSIQGTRPWTVDSSVLLVGAVAAYRATLSVVTREANDEDWALVQGNLGIALQELGMRTTEPNGREYLKEALEAHQQALRVWTQEDHPGQWASAEMNLSLTLKEQGRRTAGPEGCTLLKDARKAALAALSKLTKQEHPVAWARAQEGLALIELAFCDHEATRYLRPHVRSAISHAEAALEVYASEDLSHRHRIVADLRDRLRGSLLDLS